MLNEKLTIPVFVIALFYFNSNIFLEILFAIHTKKSSLQKKKKDHVQMIYCSSHFSSNMLAYCVAIYTDILTPLWLSLVKRPFKTGGIPGLL